MENHQKRTKAQPKWIASGIRFPSAEGAGLEFDLTCDERAGIWLIIAEYKNTRLCTQPRASRLSMDKKSILITPTARQTTPPIAALFSGFFRYFRQQFKSLSSGKKEKKNELG